MLERGLGLGLRAALNLPQPVLRAIAGPEKRNDRGDALDLQTQALLRLREANPAPKTHEQPPPKARKSLVRETRLVDPSPPTLARIESRACESDNGAVSLRVYWPRESTRPLPILVYYHGGGYVVGNLDSHDGVCRRLARDSDCIVVAVDYRCGPEEPFPAAVYDGLAAFEWARTNAEALGGDPERIAVGGDSAGGGLSAVICQQRRDADLPQPALQLLVYPAVDETRSLESHRLFAHGYYLDKPLKDWFVANYVPDPDEQRDPRASPLFAERFDSLAPAIVVSAGFDPLRDEDEAYAERLREAGVRVDEQREPSLIHGFLSMPVLSAASASGERMARSLGAALHT